MHATIAAAVDGTVTRGGQPASELAPLAVGLLAASPEVAALATGSVALAVGVLLVFVSARRARRRRRDRERAEATTRGGARGGRLVTGPVALRGTVVAGPDGVVREPLSGRESVWYRLTAFGPIAGARSHNDHVEIHSEVDARDFLLDDGSRSPPLVSVDDAGFVVPMDMYGDAAVVFGSGDLPWTRHHLTEQHVAALRARCSRPATRVVRADCHALAPGTAVTVVGWLERGATGPTLVGRPPDHPLIVYAAGEQAGDAGGGGSKGLAAIGVVLVVAGAIAVGWSAAGLP